MLTFSRQTEPQGGRQAGNKGKGLRVFNLHAPSAVIIDRAVIGNAAPDGRDGHDLAPDKVGSVGSVAGMPVQGNKAPLL